MKKFIFRFLLFTLILVPLLLFSDELISNGLKLSNSYPWDNEVLNDIYNSNINATIAIYGSSRAWVHFNTKIIDNRLNQRSYNFGQDASNFMVQYLLHKEFLRLNPHPVLIILSLDHLTFSSRPTYPPKQFLPYILWNKSVYNVLNYNKKLSKLTDYIFPIIRYTGKINAYEAILNYKSDEIYCARFNKHFSVQQNGKFRYKGYRGMNIKWTNDLENARNKFNYYEVKIDSSLIELIASFIDELKTENINLVFVYAPEYIEGQSFIKNRKEIFHYFHVMSDEHDIPFLDYSASMLSYNKKYFYNSLHLNKEGSKLFTIQLTDDLLKYNLVTDP